MITDNEAFIARTEELVARLSRLSRTTPPPNTPHEDEMADDYCAPSRRTRLTAQPQAQSKQIVYAQYDARFDVDLHPELDVSVPAEAQGIPVDWPTRIITPVPLSARA
jgi:hypothetical protein